MEKIITLFERDRTGSHMVLNSVSPGAEWVLEGTGVARRKFNGTCCMVRGGFLFKRYELRRGKSAPMMFEPVTGVDPETGKQQGWIPVEDGPEDKWHRDAFAAAFFALPDGTYELCGPKVQGNPESFRDHVLIKHRQADVMPDFPRDYEAIKETMRKFPYEGVVWHHPDGRMVKIKRRDFYR